MVNHPNRNWRSRWAVDITAQAAIHTPSGMSVRFAPHRPTATALPPVGTLAFGPRGAQYLGTPASIPDALDRRTLPRLMREAGEMYARALHGVGPGDPWPPRAATRLHNLLMATPAPGTIIESRKRAGLTQVLMAEALGLSGHARIAEYESGRHEMPRALWSLWLLMCGQHPLDEQKRSVGP